jgi:hypothetical protein
MINVVSNLISSKKPNVMRTLNTAQLVDVMVHDFPPEGSKTAQLSPQRTG